MCDFAESSGKSHQKKILKSLLCAIVQWDHTRDKQQHFVIMCMCNHGSNTLSNTPDHRAVAILQDTI